MTEAKIQKAVLNVLKWHPCVAWATRVNSGRIAGLWLASKGTSDIIGMLKGGRLLAIEVKGPKGRVKESQREWIDHINENGGAAYIVRSSQEVSQILIRELTQFKAPKEEIQNAFQELR